MSAVINSKAFAFIFFLMIFILAHRVVFSIDKDADFYFKNEDIYYEYETAKQIQKGKNPYLRILEGDMLENDKYSTQLPHYYNFLSFVRNHSNKNFSGFIESFRFILFLAQVTGGIFIFLIFRRQNAPFLSICGSIFYVFNVWTLNSIIFLKQDVLAIGLLLISLYFMRNEKYKTLSYLFYGLSLGIKYIGIFILPIYAVPSIARNLPIKKFVFNITLLLFVLIIPSIPYIVDDFNSFMRSIIFSATRSPSDSEIIYGYSGLFVASSESYSDSAILPKMVPRVPLFISIIFAFLLLIIKKISRETYVFLSLLAFAIFNSVIFPQYITWITPFALFPLLNEK